MSPQATAVMRAWHRWALAAVFLLAGYLVGSVVTARRQMARDLDCQPAVVQSNSAAAIQIATLRCLALRFERLQLTHEDNEDIGTAVILLLEVKRIAERRPPGPQGVEL